MTEMTLSLGVRQIGETVCILDIEGDITAFSEEVADGRLHRGRRRRRQGRDPQLHRARVHELGRDRVCS